ncbi:MAG: HAD family hydrolase, partial [Pseudomonadota bacterium]
MSVIGSRPLLISDCDEVLLHMIVPFRDWLDEAHHIHFDLVHGDWGEALRHKHDGTVVERGQVWDLLNGFFDTEMHRQ